MASSFFMQDNSEGNYGTEAILDFQMSWLMRLSEEGQCRDNKLAEISRKVMLILLGRKKTDNVCIKKVEVWKQWRHIDLLAEVTIQEQDAGKGEEKHIIVVENKVYTKLRDNQLNKNSAVVSDYYKNSPNTDIHYWLINCNEDTWDEFNKSCKEADEEWKQLWFYDVIGGELKEPIGNELFDEFWVRKWY